MENLWFIIINYIKCTEKEQNKINHKSILIILKIIEAVQFTNFVFELSNDTR